MEKENLIKYTIVEEKENTISDIYEKINKFKLLILYLCEIINYIAFIVHNVLMLFIFYVMLYYREKVIQKVFVIQEICSIIKKRQKQTINYENINLSINKYSTTNKDSNSKILTIDDENDNVAIETVYSAHF